MSLDEELKFADGRLKKHLLEAETQRVKYEAEILDLKRNSEASRVEMANEISTLSKSGVFVLTTLLLMMDFLQSSINYKS